jgi:hypothetical protein
MKGAHTMHALLGVSALTVSLVVATPAAAQPVDLSPTAEQPAEVSPAAAQPAGDEEIHAYEVKEGPAAKAPAPSGDRSPIDGVMGHFGIGYFTGDAPVGVRYWMDRGSAIDVGVDVAFSSGDVEAHRYGVEAGYVLALAHYHYAVVFGRLGAGYRFLDTSGDAGGPERHDLNANLFLGAELFLGAFGFPNVSLQGGYGLEANYTYHGGSAFLIGTVDGGLNVVSAGTVGFHIYL